MKKKWKQLKTTLSLLFCLFIMQQAFEKKYFPFSCTEWFEFNERRFHHKWKCRFGSSIYLKRDTNVISKDAILAKLMLRRERRKVLHFDLFHSTLQYMINRLLIGSFFYIVMLWLAQKTTVSVLTHPIKQYINVLVLVVKHTCHTASNTKMIYCKLIIILKF